MSFKFRKPKGINVAVPEDETGFNNFEIKTIKEKMEELMGSWFQNEFIGNHRSWHAVYGNRNARPIPISQCFSFPGDETKGKYVWPTNSPDLVDMYLVELGFLTLGRAREKNISLMVPKAPASKVVRRSFAQKWVERVNKAHAIYCNREKRRADMSYQEMLGELKEWPDDKIRIIDGKIFYRDFVFSHATHLDSAVSPQYQKFFQRILRYHGFNEEMDQEGNYVGMTREVEFEGT